MNLQKIPKWAVIVVISILLLIGILLLFNKQLVGRAIYAQTTVQHEFEMVYRDDVILLQLTPKSDIDIVGIRFKLQKSDADICSLSVAAIDPLLNGAGLGFPETACNNEIFEFRDATLNGKKLNQDTTYTLVKLSGFETAENSVPLDLKDLHIAGKEEDLFDVPLTHFDIVVIRSPDDGGGTGDGGGPGDQGVGVCSSENLPGCTDAASCADHKGVWQSDACKNCAVDTDCSTGQECENRLCESGCSSTILSSCTSLECQGLGKVWSENNCHDCMADKDCCMDDRNCGQDKTCDLATGNCMIVTASPPPVCDVTDAQCMTWFNILDESKMLDPGFNDNQITIFCEKNGITASACRHLSVDLDHDGDVDNTELFIIKLSLFAKDSEPQPNCGKQGEPFCYFSSQGYYICENLEYIQVITGSEAPSIGQTCRGIEHITGGTS